MDRSFLWLREHPQLAAVGSFVLITLLITAVLGTVMARSGISLRPLIWFLGFLAIVAVPQGAVHCLDALLASGSKTRPAPELEPVRSRAAKDEETVGKASSSENSLQPVLWETVFGPNLDPDLVIDAKEGLEPVLADAEEAQLSFQATGESALAARFTHPNEAAAALNRYGAFFQFARASGSDGMGWTAKRFAGQGEWNHVVAAGNELYAWTGPTRESVLKSRVRALGPLVEEEIPEAGASGPGDSNEPAATPVSEKLRRHPAALAAFVAINLSAAVFWFFKGSAWAARERGRHGGEAVDMSSLRSRLLELNGQEAPIALTLGQEGNTLEANWRYGDARWFDLMRAHQTKRVHRLALLLDEKGHTVRVREYWSAFDASAGPDGVDMRWEMAKGMQFFAFEHRRVFGAQLDAAGKLTGELSKAYTFNLQELKGPVMDAVTGSGWTWQPVMWNAPAGLRWLTE